MGSRRQVSAHPLLPRMMIDAQCCPGRDKGMQKQAWESMMLQQVLQTRVHTLALAAACTRGSGAVVMRALSSGRTLPRPS